MGWKDRLTGCGNDDDIRELLKEAADQVNGNTKGADGNYSVEWGSPEKGYDYLFSEGEAFEDKWVVVAEGAISNGCDEDGNETWDDQTYPTGYYLGDTLREAAEKFLDELDKVLL